MTFGILVAIACIVWVLSCALSLLAVYWNTGAQRLRGAFITSIMGLLIAYAGFSRIQLNASKTVNNVVVWSLNSRWFFIAALVLGAGALGLTAWNWRKAKTAPAQASQEAV